MNLSNRDIEQLSEEAYNRIIGGEHPDTLVHVITYPDGTLYGLSTGLSPYTDLKGYTEPYHPLCSFI